MKIKTLIKALYYSNPELFGFDEKSSQSIDYIYSHVVKNVEVDNCKHISNLGIRHYVNVYIEEIKDNVLDFYENNYNYT